MRNALIILFLLVSGLLAAQAPAIDSAKHELETKYVKRDTARLSALIRLVNIGAYLAAVEQMHPYALECLELGKELNDKRGVVRYHLYIGMLNRKRNQFADALISFDSALLVLGNDTAWKTRKGRADVYIQRALISERTEDYNTALKDNLEAVRLIGKRAGKDLVDTYDRIADMYETVRNPNMAITYSRKAIETAEAIQNESVMLYICLGHVQRLINVRNLGDARLYLDTAGSLDPDNHNFYSQFRFYYLRGKLARLRKDYIPAQQDLGKALEVLYGKSHQFFETGVLHELSLTMFEQKQYVQAKDYALRELAIANKLKSKKDKLESFKDLAAITAAMGDYNTAYTYSSEAIAVKDSLLQEENIKQINLMEARFQSDKKQKEILSLQKDNELHVLSLRQQSTLNKILIGAVALLLLAGLLIYRNFRSRQIIARQQAQLQEQKIRELEREKQLLASDAILKGQEEERSRLARDLHDGLGGMLSGVKYSLNNMKGNLIMTEENAMAFERSVDMLDNSIKELRRVAHNMMPESLMKFGLDTALRDLCSEINNTQALKVIYQSMDMEKLQVDQSTAVTVYRIVQELVNNAIRHSGATQVVVQLAMPSDALEVTVEDDGKGFDTMVLHHARGMGWSNIQSRVDYLKGNIDIESVPGQGTSVIIELPV